MDVIEFKLSDYDCGRVITIINGTKVSKLASKAEQMKDYNTPYGEEYRRLHGEEEYDKYGDGTDPGWLYYELKGIATEPYLPIVSETRLGETYKYRNRVKHKRAAVLGCACGADGCDQYFVKVTETENSVIWDDDFALRHNKPNYFHFEFEKKQYYKEVEKLVGLTLQMGELEGLPIEIMEGY